MQPEQSSSDNHALPTAAPRWSQEYASQQVKAWQASGQRLATWCRAHGVIPHRLKYWHTRLERLAAAEDAVPHPVTLIPIIKEKGERPITVWVGEQVRMELHRDSDLAVLRSVVEVLR